MLKTLEIKKCASDYRVYVWLHKGDIVILNLSTDDILIAKNGEVVRAKVKEVLRMFFNVTPNTNPSEFRYLN